MKRDAPPGLVGELWAATDVLMGLRYDEALTAHLLRGVRGMRESVTYQAIPREGREEGLERGRAEGEILGMRRAVLNLGTRKFGPPAATMTATLEQIADLAVLQRLTDSVLDASSWDELLAPTID